MPSFLQIAKVVSQIAGVKAEEKKSEFPSLDIVFEQVKGRLASQDAQAAVLDTKANTGLGSSTLITTLLGLKLEDTLPAVPTATQFALAILLAVIGIIYVLTVYCAYKAYQLRGFTTVNLPR